MPIDSLLISHVESIYWYKRVTLVGLSPQTKLQDPTNWDMKHYKSVEFLSNLNVKPPLHRRKAPPSHKRKVPLFTTFWRRFCIKAVGKLQAWNENSKFLRRRQETFLTPSSCAIRGWSAGAEPGGATAPKNFAWPSKNFSGLFLKVLHRPLAAPLDAKLAPPVAPQMKMSVSAPGEAYLWVRNIVLPETFTFSGKIVSPKKDLCLTTWKKGAKIPNMHWEPVVLARSRKTTKQMHLQECCRTTLPESSGKNQKNKHRTSYTVMITTESEAVAAMCKKHFEILLNSSKDSDNVLTPLYAKIEENFQEVNTLSLNP